MKRKCVHGTCCCLKRALFSPETDEDLDCAGEDTVVSVTGGQRSRHVSSDISGDPTLQGVALEVEEDG